MVERDTELYTRRNKLPPFKPTSSTHTYINVFDDATKEQKISIRKSEKLLGKNLVDAETGEPIKFSRSTWNAREGRLDLRTDIIVAMGTGRLDIKQRRRVEESMTGIAADAMDRGKADPAKPKSDSYGRPSAQFAGTHSPSRHPIITQYLLEGPLNPRCHTKWDVRSDKILVSDENDLLIMAEDGVDFSLKSTHAQQPLHSSSSSRPAYTKNVLLASSRAADASAGEDGYLDETDDSAAVASVDSSHTPPSIASQTALSLLSTTHSPLPRRARSPNIQQEADQQIGQTLGT